MAKRRSVKRRRGRWIRRAMKRGKRGALRRQLGIPAGQNIPLALLRKAARKSRRHRYKRSGK